VDRLEQRLERAQHAVDVADDPAHDSYRNRAAIAPVEWTGEGDTAMTNELTSKRSRPIEKGTPALGDDVIRKYLAMLPGWERKGNAIAKTFTFKNYHETMAFVNATAWVSHREDHHPDMEVGYNKVTMRYSTHSVGGLSENDFICAAKVNELLDGPRPA